MVTTLFDFDPFSRFFGASERKLLAKGERATGVVVGIRRCLDGETMDRYEYAIDMRTAAGVTRIGVRQKNTGGQDAILGAELGLITDGKRAIIVDRPELGDFMPSDWKALSKPPAEGVRDDRINLKGGEPLTVEIVSATARTAFGGPTENMDMTLRGEDGTTYDVPREEIPFYARHLTEPGTQLQAVLLKKGKLRIDWAGSAMRAA